MLLPRLRASLFVGGDRRMRRRLGFRLGLFGVVATALVLAGSASSQRTSASLEGNWRIVPEAPLGRLDLGATSVWTGRSLIVFGRVTAFLKSGDVTRVYRAAAYTPATGKWRRLPSPPKSVSGIYGFTAVWTGKDMLVWGQGTRAAFNPRTNRWRLLPAQPALDGAALVVWTGKEMIGWGGGCCGEAWADGVAYNPATNTWRKLAPSPLHADQGPVGAWTGRELIVLVDGTNPLNGTPWPARFARAAAYDPSTDTWRRIAPPPAPHQGATAVWDGRELLLVGGYAHIGTLPWRLARTGFAYDPETNRWREISPLDSGRTGFAVAWTGTRLILWGGTTMPGGGAKPVKPQSPPRGLAYDPSTGRWSALPISPLRGRLYPTAVWTGRSLIVWGGGTQMPPYASFTDGAIFTPLAPV
jgi:hypothetical protein